MNSEQADWPEYLTAIKKQERQGGVEVSLQKGVVMMRKLATIAFLVLATCSTTLAQDSKDEQEILKIHSSLDRAFVEKDAAVFSSVFLRMITSIRRRPERC